MLSKLFLPIGQTVTTGNIIESMGVFSTEVEIGFSCMSWNEFSHSSYTVYY